MLVSRKLMSVKNAHKTLTSKYGCSLGVSGGLLLLAIIAACDMPLLPTTHAAFICPSNASLRNGRHPQVAQAVQFRLSHGPPMPCLMASVACRDGKIDVPRKFPTVHKPSETSTCSDDGDNQKETVECVYPMCYRIFRPMSLSSRQAAPLLVLHGGPSVPSDYLYPLVDFVPYRSIVFYDQIGCGRSSIPTDLNAYSIKHSLDDLELLIQKLNLRRFHLYGQSFGGILAFEYLKRVAERKGEQKARLQTTDHRGEESEGCLSVILSSAPTSVEVVEREANRLVETLRKEDNDETTLGERFRIRYQCRTAEMPTPLVDAYAHAGTLWRGTSAIPDYVASPPSDKAAKMPSAMFIRGEHDFVTEVCVADWKQLFNHKFVREKTLEGCAHHGLLENGPMYGEIINSFCSEYD